VDDISVEDFISVKNSAQVSIMLFDVFDVVLFVFSWSLLAGEEGGVSLSEGTPSP